MDAPRLPGQWPRRIADEALRMQVRAVLVGWEPAEALPGALARECAIRVWHADGLTDLEMARVSRWSVHTVRRLRDRHGLRANPEPLTWRYPA